MFDGLKQSEYTGENRCLPCTVVNALVALVAAAVVGRRSRRAGAGVLVGSAVVIYLRGYLVPGTPTLTKRYLPEEALRLFGKEPVEPARTGLGAGLERDRSAEGDRRPASTPGDEGDGIAPGDAEVVEAAPSGGSGEAAPNGESSAVEAARDEADALDPEAVLLHAGALEECEDGEDLCLTGEFKRSWDEEMAAIADEEGERLAELVVSQFDLDVEDVEIEEFDDGRVLTDGDGRVGQWPSEAAMIADAAGAAVLRGRLSGWDDLDTREKGSLLNGLRLFLEECPTADGGIEFGQETVESCCSSYEVVAVTCEETGERVFEQPIRE